MPSNKKYGWTNSSTGRKQRKPHDRTHFVVWVLNPFLFPSPFPKGAQTVQNGFRWFKAIVLHHMRIISAFVSSHSLFCADFEMDQRPWLDREDSHEAPGLHHLWVGGLWTLLGPALNRRITGAASAAASGKDGIDCSGAALRTAAGSGRGCCFGLGRPQKNQLASLCYHHQSHPK